MLLAAFSSCCCYEFWLPFTSGPQMGTHLVLGCENAMEKITSRQENTMPLKDGEAPKLHPENA